MKNWLMYYYNLNIDGIYPHKDENLIFEKNSDCFLLKKYDDNTMNLNNLSILNKNFNLLSSHYYSIILNKFDSYVSKIDDNDYILLKIKGLISERIELDGIVKNLILNRNTIADSNLNWGELWQKRVDYIEYQIGQLGKNKKEVLNSFCFFSGLAENAISFISQNHVDYKQCRKSLCHKRIGYPNEAIDYFNVFDLKTDYEVRDLAEYLKSKILVSDNLNEELNFIINKCDYNSDELKLFYARLMFPSYYFDLVEEILISNDNESKIEKYLEQLDVYLDFLKDTYIELSKKMELLIPKWVKIEN